MRVAKILSICFVAVMLSGCGVVAEKNVKNYMETTPVSAWGEPPSGYEEEIKKIILGILIDPESARFKFYEPARSYIAEDVFKEKLHPVWEVAVLVNSKNRMGGYSGDTPMFFRFVNGYLTAYNLTGKASY
jgi:hypothetical protein